MTNHSPRVRIKRKLQLSPPKISIPSSEEGANQGINEGNEASGICLFLSLVSHALSPSESRFFAPWGIHFVALAFSWSRASQPAHHHRQPTLTRNSPPLLRAPSLLVLVLCSLVQLLSHRTLWGSETADRGLSTIGATGIKGSSGEAAVAVVIGCGAVSKQTTGNWPGARLRHRTAIQDDDDDEGNTTTGKQPSTATAAAATTTTTTTAMLTEEFVSAICGAPLSSNTAIAKDVGIYCHTLSPAYSVKSTFKKSSVPVNCLAVSETHVFAAQHEKAYVHVYSRLRGNQEAFVAFPERIRCVALVGDVLVMGTAEGRLMLWEVSDARDLDATGHERPSPCRRVCVGEFQPPPSSQGRLTFVTDMHWPASLDPGPPRPGYLLRGCHALPCSHRV